MPVFPLTAFVIVDSDPRRVAEPLALLWTCSTSEYQAWERAARTYNGLGGCNEADFRRAGAALGLSCSVVTLTDACP